MENPNKNIVDDLLISRNYIILISGLNKSPIEQVSSDLVKSFEQYAVNLNFMHLDFTDKTSIVQDRIKSIITEKTQIIIIIGQNFDSNMAFKNSHILRINLSVDATMIGDDEKATQYKNALLVSGINKYFDFKEDTDVQEYINMIYWYIIDDIERRVYGVEYKKLSYKYFVEQSEKEYSNNEYSNNEYSNNEYSNKEYSNKEYSNKEYSNKEYSNKEYSNNYSNNSSKIVIGDFDPINSNERFG